MIFVVFLTLGNSRKRVVAVGACDMWQVTYDTIKHDKDRDMNGKSGDKLGYRGTDMDRH